MITLEEYNKQILRPMVLHHIKSGAVDDVIFNLEFDEFYADDLEVLNAVKARRAILEQAT